MSLVAILALAAVVLGALCFWISGLLAGKRGKAEQPGPAATFESMRQQMATLQTKLAAAESERSQVRKELATAEQELTRAAEELGRAEAQLSQAEGEIARLSLSDITEEERAALASTPPPLPFPDPDEPRPDPIDDALSKLRPSLLGEKSPEEIEELKAMAEMPTDMPPPPGDADIANMPTDMPPPPGADSSPPPRRDRKGAGFQTVSIASRNTDVPSVEHDRLRAAHDKLKREKEELEAEFARARQELQLLKLRDK
jgi:hypothetical protein